MKNNKPEKTLLTPEGVLLFALFAWNDSEPQAHEFLSTWFSLAIERGCNPLVIEGLKNVISRQAWDPSDVEPWISRIYPYSKLKSLSMK